MGAQQVGHPAAIENVAVRRGPSDELHRAGIGATTATFACLSASGKRTDQRRPWCVKPVRSNSGNDGRPHELELGVSQGSALLLHNIRRQADDVVQLLRGGARKGRNNEIQDH
eukprot:scaffold15446_cov107-Isochrysis_galbana.AAC.1